MTIKGRSGRTDGIGKAIVTLPNNTQIRIEKALYIRNAEKNLLAYKDIIDNSYKILVEGRFLIIIDNENKEKERIAMNKTNLFSYNLHSFPNRPTAKETSNTNSDAILWHRR